MMRVLFVGQIPETVDYSDPALPPGLNAEKIYAGIDVAAAKIAEKGWLGDICNIAPDDDGMPRSRSNWRARPTTAWSLAAACGYRPRVC